MDELMAELVHCLNSLINTPLNLSMGEFMAVVTGDR